MNLGLLPNTSDKNDVGCQSEKETKVAAEEEEDDRKKFP